MAAVKPRLETIPTWLFEHVAYMQAIGLETSIVQHVKSCGAVGWTVRWLIGPPRVEGYVMQVICPCGFVSGIRPEVFDEYHGTDIGSEVE